MKRIRSCKVLLLVTLAVVVPTTAADAAPYTATGTVANKCSIAPTTVAVTYRRTGGTVTTTVAGVTGTSTTVAVRCNAATGGNLSVTATNLAASGQTSRSYTVNVTGWGSAITYVTPNATPGTSSNAARSATVTVAISNIPVTTNFANNTTYNSTITLSITAN